jgi:hypothetical protein
MTRYKPLYEHFDEEEEQEEGPQPEDIVISTTSPLGSKYSVDVVEGEHLGEFATHEEVNVAVREYTDKNQFWPGIWFISDHGNINPWSIED